MIHYELKGRTVLVTGGASGIGFTTATMLARAGAGIAINFLPDDPRGPEAVAKLVAEGLLAVAAPGNVALAVDAEAMVQDAVEQLGRLDLLVNNAGTPGLRQAVEPARMDLLSDDLWSTVLSTNLLGTFHCSRAAAPALRRARGAVVNLASIAGLNSPGSIVSLTKNLARALAPEVRVNGVAPGAVDSDWPIEWTDERRQSTIDKALLKRRCTTEDIAGAIAYLGFGANMITGQTIVVDGGLTLQIA